MSDNNVLKLSQPSTFSDPLTEVLRSGARSLLARAVEAEVAAFLDGHSEARTEEGRRRLVRHGHLPEREIMTGIGPVAVRAPRVRDRTGQGAERIRFSSALLPPYARRSKSLEVLIPALYLKGISTGDFAEALAALLGPDAGGLSASTVARLTEVWADQHAHWLKRDLSARHYVYFWADGIHVQARLEDDAQCLLVIIGATPEGKKELVGLIDGVRESAQSWRELLLDLKRRGLAVAPDLAIADGALGFWKAIEEVWPRTRSQRLRRLHRDLRRQIRQGGRLPGQGSRDDAGVLRLSRRALEASAHHQPHRKHSRHRATPYRAIQGMPLQQDGARHGLQTRPGGTEQLAPPRRTQPVAQADRRRKVHRRNRSRQATTSSRRLTQTVTTIRL